jgi:hypothetical protein
MANATSASQGTKLRPEDATTLEEFQARRDAELARISAPGAYWKQVFRIVLAVVCAGIDAFYWYRVSQVSGEEVWHVLALALLFACSTISAASSVTPDILHGSKGRRAELDRLGAQWQERGEGRRAGETRALTPVFRVRGMAGPTDDRRIPERDRQRSGNCPSRAALPAGPTRAARPCAHPLQPGDHPCSAPTLTPPRPVGY